MIYIPESESIYYPKTREYFSEVLSCYANKNYRSAIVMLYSVAVCDLLFKLEELSDLYQDSVAKEILEEINKSKTDERYSKSRWEGEFIERVYKKTEILDLEAYTNLKHLYDHRNFSAHPALNDNYELIEPSQETTIAHIKNVLENILVKPPIFIKRVFDMLTEDLADKKKYYIEEPDKLKEYLCHRYYDRMSAAMKKTTFRSFWKICFCLPENEECKENISINRKAMQLLYDETPEITDYIKTESMFEKTSSDERCVLNLCVLLANRPQIYGLLSEDTKLQIASLVDTNGDARLLSWFLQPNKTKHLEIIMKNQYYDRVQPEAFRFAAEQYASEGRMDSFLDYCIEYYASSQSFDGANERYNCSIKPMLDQFSRHQFERLIAVINENDQIYNRHAARYTNTEIVMAASQKIGSDYDYKLYPHFIFDEEKAFAEIGSEDQERDNEIQF